jgi:hypothetical protein
MVGAVHGFPVLLGGVMGAVVCASLAAAADPPQTLIDPQWQQQRDSQGAFWMFDPQSSVRINGGMSMLMNINPAMVNNMQFMPSRVQMRPDGTEYVFEANNANNNPFGGMAPTLLTLRRIKLDLQSSTVRFVDSFQNPGPTPIQVNVATGSSMRVPIQSVMSGPSGTTLNAANGQPMLNPATGAVPYSVPGGAMVHLSMPEHDCGIVLQSPVGGFPGLMFYVPESANVKPSIDIQSMRRLQVSYTLTVPAQATASVVWGLVQRPQQAKLDAAEIKNQLKVFQSREWLADLPESVAKSIVNYRRFSSSPNSSAGSLLQPVLDIAAQYGIERGKVDVLVQDEQTQLSGLMTGSNFFVGTPLGKTSVPLSEVALFCGGAGADRPMRLYLRNGEILTGQVNADSLVLKAQTGVEAKLLPKDVHMLFLHAGRDDGKTVAAAHSVLETNDGLRLLLSGSDAPLHAVTPWGALDVGLSEIESLVARRDPQPVYRLTLKDGSSLSVLFQGEFPLVQSLRFGPVNLSSAGVRQLSSLKALVLAKESDREERVGLAGPHCRLIDDTVLSGTIDLPNMTVTTAGGVLSIAMSQIREAQHSSDPQADGPFDIQLDDGRRINGRLTNRTLTIRFHGKVWTVPAQHLIGIHSGKKAVDTGSSTEADSAKSTTASLTEEAKPKSALPPVTPAPDLPTQPSPRVPSRNLSRQRLPRAYSNGMPRAAPMAPMNQPTAPANVPTAPVVPLLDDPEVPIP